MDPRKSNMSDTFELNEVEATKRYPTNVSIKVWQIRQKILCEEDLI